MAIDHLISSTIIGVRTQKHRNLLSVILIEFDQFVMPQSKRQFDL